MESQLTHTLLNGVSSQRYVVFRGLSACDSWPFCKYRIAHAVRRNQWKRGH